MGKPAFGAIEGSPHDLIAQEYDVAKDSALQERCTCCHLPSSPGNKAFLPAVPPVLGLTQSVSSLTCFSCHDGTTIVSPQVDASRTAFHPASHGYDLAGYEGLFDEASVLPSLEGRRMICLTCHDPHDNGHRPMLRFDIAEICLVCHSPLNEYGRGEENYTGNHPQGADPAGPAREEAPLRVVPAFTTPFPSPYPLSGGRAGVGIHWDLGGHLSEGESGTMVCVTCHAVHGDEKSPPRPGELLAVDPVRSEADLFCEGCHAGERGDDQAAPPHPNPGGTTTARTYHPADDDRSNADKLDLETREPENWPLGTAFPRPILCSTCHRAHAATERSALLRRPPDGQGFCEVCHDRLPLEYHHPLVVEGAGACSAQVEFTDPVTGIRRTCDFCHRAHNAGLGTGRESAYIPLLRDSLLNNDSCLRCHPQGNPTCGERPDYLASHFLGDPTLPETYEDDAPPYRLTAWPASKLSSLYGGDESQIMICLSCHSFRLGSVVSGDDGKRRFLLAESGNPVEWDEDEGVYLCTGCHSGSPGTGAGEKGHSHPLMDARVEVLDREAEPPLTTTPSNHINCDSCHRPHEARTAGGYYILEVVDSLNKEPQVVHPTIDFTPLCHSCHPPGEY